MIDMDGPAQEILKELLAEFAAQKRPATDLKGEYVGLSLPELKQKLSEDGAADVDFDLALAELMEKKLVGTGPLYVPPAFANSEILVMPGLRSRNEYAYLTEAGYRMARKAAGSKPSARVSQHLHISGGTFHQSAIGLGHEVSQSMTTTVTSAPVFTDLRDAVLGSEIEPGQQAELLARIEAMESARKSGGFIQKYQEFMAAAANHMTLMAPFLPALTALLK